MKTTMFDKLDKVPEGIDESTITPLYDINPEKVQEGVHKKLAAAKSGSTKTNAKVKRRTKKTTVFLAAAAVSILALGTLTVGAMGGINSLVGEHSAGKMINNLYPGGEIRLTTNGNITGEFLGITGDDTNMVSVTQLRNADGSDIIENGKEGFVETNDYYNYYNNTCKQFEEDVLAVNPVTDPIPVGEELPMRKAMVWHTVGYDITDTTAPEFDNDAHGKISHTIWFRDPFDTPYPAFVEYEFADSKTINCYISSHIDSGLFQSLKGETLKETDNNLYVYQIDKVLFKADTAYDYAYFIADTDKFNSLITENINSLNDDQVITMHNYSMVIATRKVIDIDMDLSVKLNYKSNTKQLTPPSDTLKGENGIDYKVSKVTAGSLSTEMILDFDVPEGKSQYEAFSGLKSEYSSNIKINLKNGKVLYADYTINHNYEELYSVTLRYYDSDDEFSRSWVIVNPEEIKSIEFNGVTISA